MFATIIFFVAFFVCLCVFRYVIKPKLKIARAIDKLPSPASIPILGHTYLFYGTTPCETFIKGINYYEEYGPLCKAWVGVVPFVITGKPDYIEVIMKSSTNISKGMGYDPLLPWLGDGVLLSTGNKWFRRRKLLTPAFHFQILKDFVQIFIEKSEVLLHKFENYSDGKEFDVYPIMLNYTLDIVAEASMNVKIDALTSTNSSYAKAIHLLCQHVMDIQLKPWIKIVNNPLFSYGREIKKNISIVHNFTKKVIQERKKTLFSNIRQIEEHFGKKRRLCFLDILLQGPDDDVGLTDSEIREEVDTFMFAGHHTTGTSISWTLFLLGNHPEIQESVYEEIKSVLVNNKTPNNIEDLNELKYLECVIKESLRLYPSVPIVMRKLSEDVYLDKFRVPKDCHMIFPIYSVHRSSEYWDNPDEFDPTRFYHANCTGRHPYCYIPFSAGKRNCIGQRFAMYAQKTVLATILKNYKVKSMTKLEDMKPTFEVVLKSCNGINIVLEKRN
ncbi:cytochrome P450 4C1-like [Onthophagus taurus]|uniref:cytochrome P450 4C1-like n=1 Tax=Onthophagus taurus TaxID=166361 RepID=UPI0039BE80A5